MIASQKPAGTNVVEAGDSVVEPAAAAAVIRRKSARQALTDRASRGLSLMSGFKSRQEKTGDVPTKLGWLDRSPVSRKGDKGVAAGAGGGDAGAAAAAAAASTSGAPHAAATFATAATAVTRAGRSSSEEDFGAVGGPGHLTKLVLKFTTASESDVQPSCEISTAGASIGQSEDNTVSIPSDSMLAPLNHAMVTYEHARGGSNNDDNGGGGAGSCGDGGGRDVVPGVGVNGGDGGSSGGVREGGDTNGLHDGGDRGRDGGGGGGDGSSSADAESGGVVEGGREGFFFSDGGQGTDFAAAFRIRVGEGNREWRLTQGCHFSAGLTVFRAHLTKPTSGETNDDDSNAAEEAGRSSPSPAVDASVVAAENDAEGVVSAPEEEEDAVSSSSSSSGSSGSSGSSRGNEDGSVVSIPARADGGSSTRAAEEVPTIDADAGCAHAINDASNDTGVVESAKQPPPPPPATAAAAAAATTPTATTQAPSVAEAQHATAEAEGRVLSPAEPPRLWLEAVAGCLKGRSWMVEAAGATLGRASDNTLSLADKEMSRRHSKIEYDEALSEFFLCDLGSLNGTYMQMVGPYVSHRRLALGDHLLVGRTGFSVNRFDYGISERMGARPTMEDRSIVIQDLALPGLEGTYLWPQTFAAVYDGHGGGQASEYLWGNLHTKVTSSLASRSKRLLKAAAEVEVLSARSPGSKLRGLGLGGGGQGLFGRAGGGLGLGRKSFWGGGAQGGAAAVGGGGGSGGGGSEGGGGGGGGAWEALDTIVKEAISEAFAAADKEFIATSRLPEAGSTATTCLVLGPRLYMANVGDSRTVLCRGGKVRMASNDHKPSRADEQERVQRAGGFVAHRRVMGELAVSRAFGDSEFKGRPGKGGGGGGRASANREGALDADAMEERETAYAQLITAEPEFLVSEITPQDEFLVLACDGVFDVLTSEEVVANVYEKMKIHADAQRCCEDLTEKAIVERRTRDNVSLVLLVFNKWF